MKLRGRKKIEENQGLAGNSEEEKELPEEQIPGQMEVTDYPEIMPEAEPVAVQEEKDDKNRLGGNRESIPESKDSGRDESKGNEMSGREPETAQSNGKSSEKENYEEVREAAEEKLDAVHAVFWGWKNEKIIPEDELKMALKNANNLVKYIEQLLKMTGEQ